MDRKTICEKTFFKGISETMQKNVEIQQKTFLSSVSGYLDCTHCTPVSLGLRVILGSS